VSTQLGELPATVRVDRVAGFGPELPSNRVRADRHAVVVGEHLGVGCDLADVRVLADDPEFGLALPVHGVVGPQPAERRLVVALVEVGLVDALVDRALLRSCRHRFSSRARVAKVR
jgi:hypothetical protein